MSTIDLPTIRQRISVDGSALDGLKSKMGGLARTLGKGVAVGAGIAAAGVAAFVGKGVAGAVDVERGVREVVTLFGETGEAANAMTAELSAGVADLSQEVGLAQDAITGGLYSAISAGVPKENAFDFMRVASEASIAGVTDVETAVDGLTTTINAFGLDADDAQAVADSMFAAVQGGKTTFEELSASMFNVAPAAAGLGVGFEEVNAAIATLTASGTPTSVATTQMRAALAELGKEGSVAGDTFAEIAGTTFPEFVAQGGTLEEGLAMMAEEAGGNATQLANMFGSVEAGQAAMALGVTNAEKFGEELERQEGAAGSATDAYETMDQSTSRAMERLRTTFDNLAIEVGSQLLPALATAAEWLGERLPGWIETARPIVESMVSTFMDVARWVGEHAPAAIETMRAALEPLVAGFQRVAEVVGPVIEAIVSRFTSGGESMGETGGKISAIFTQVGEVVSAIGETIGLVAEWIAGVWARYGEQLIANVRTAFDALLKIIGGALDVIVGIFDVVLGVLTGDWSRAWEGIKGIVTGLWDVIVGVVTAGINGIRNLIGVGLAVIQSVFGTVWGSIKRGVGNVVGAIVDYFRDMVSGARAEVGAMVAFVRGLPGRILSAIGNLASLLRDAGRNVIQGLIDGIGDKIQAVRDKISSVASTIRDHLPFSPAREGPLSGRGAPDRAGSTIAQMLADGIDDEQTTVKRSARKLAALVDANLPHSLDVAGSSRGLVGAAAAARRHDPADTQAEAGRSTSVRIDVATHDPAAVARALDSELGYQALAGRV